MLCGFPNRSLHNGWQTALFPDYVCIHHDTLFLLCSTAVLAAHTCPQFARWCTTVATRLQCTELGRNLTRFLFMYWIQRRWDSTRLYERLLTLTVTTQTCLEDSRTSLEKVLGARAHDLPGRRQQGPATLPVATPFSRRMFATVWTEHAGYFLKVIVLRLWREFENLVTYILPWRHKSLKRICNAIARAHTHTHTHTAYLRLLCCTIFTRV
jgi:hypothetical protein